MHAAVTSPFSERLLQRAHSTPIPPSHSSDSKPPRPQPSPVTRGHYAPVASFWISSGGSLGPFGKVSPPPRSALHPADSTSLPATSRCLTREGIQAPGITSYMESMSLNENPVLRNPGLQVLSACARAHTHAHAQSHDGRCPNTHRSAA